MLFAVCQTKYRKEAKNVRIYKNLLSLRLTIQPISFIMEYVIL